MTLAWEDHCDRLKELWITQDKDVEEIQAEMKLLHNFDARISQYRSQFKKWKWRKYITSDEWELINNTLTKRTEEGRKSEVYFNHVRIPDEKIKREISRHVKLTPRFTPVQIPQHFQDIQIRSPTPITPEGLTANVQQIFLNTSASVHTKRKRSMHSETLPSNFKMQRSSNLGEESTMEGKDTVFFDTGTETSNTRIKNFKKRNQSRELSLRLAIPAAVSYNTTSLNIEETSIETIFKEAISSPSSLSQSPTYSAAYATLAESEPSETNRSLITKTNIPVITSTSMLHRYLYNDTQPWSPFHLSHQLGDHHVVLSRHRDILDRVRELVDMPDMHNSSPQTHFIDNQMIFDSYIDIEYEQGPDTLEAATLENIFNIGITLTDYLNIHGESGLTTLAQEFKLAKAIERIGNREEAEYHCRRILAKVPQIEVQVFLGMILAATSRLEESMLLLLSAIAQFIMDFLLYSLKENFQLFKLVESLLIETFFRNDDLDCSPLTQCWIQMAQTIQTVYDKEDIQQIAARLICHGFSLAHQCSILDILHGAKHIYKVLLEHSDLSLDVTIDAIEKAKAHQKYGLLLRGDEEWITSAEQVILALKSAANYDMHLMALLRSDYLELSPHLLENDSITEQLRQMLPHIGSRDSSQIQDTPEDISVLPVEEDLLSDLPTHFTSRGPFAVSYVAEFELPLRASKPAKGSGSRTSITEWSSSVSRKIALTYSDCEISGVSDSVWAQ